MEKITEQKIIAGAKIAFGTVRIGGAIATACGVGIVGGFLRHRHMGPIAARIAKIGFEGGKGMLDEGLAEWKQAQ